MKYLSILFLLALVSCGGGGGSAPVSVGGNNTGHGCTIEEVAGLGANITCDGVTVFVPNGANGEKGEKGDKGDSGQNGTNGTNGVDGTDGGFNVFSEALLIHASKRKSVFRLTVYCEVDNNGDGIFGDSWVENGILVNKFASHYGTGFLIANNKIATNKHVAGNENCQTAASSVGWDGRVYEIYVQSVANESDNLAGGSDTVSVRGSGLNVLLHSNYDLATFEVNQSFAASRTPFEIDDTNNESLLTPTLSMSFPLGIPDMITNIGEIVTDDVITFSGYDFMTSNDTDGGSSGSPIIDITTGKVIGLVTAGFSGVSMNPSIIIHASRLNEI